MTSKNTLGQRIKIARTNKNFTLEELGNKVGMTKSALSKIERGLVTPSSRNLHLLSKALDVPIDWLMSGDARNKKDYLTLVSIGQRIKYLRQKAGISMETLAEGIKSNTGTITYWENDKRLPGAEYIVRLSDFFNVSTDWLLKGEETRQDNIFFKDKWELITQTEGTYPTWPYISDASLKGSLRRYFERIKDLPEEDIELLDAIADRFIKASATRLQENVSQQTQIPILGAAAAGQPVEAIRFLEGYLSVPNGNINCHNCFAIRVRGDSMKNAGILDGGYVIVRQQPIVENNEIALVMIDNEVTIKRFKLVEDTAVLISENDNYKPMVYRRTEDMAILGKIIDYIPAEEAVVKDAADDQ